LILAALLAGLLQPARAAQTGYAARYSTEAKMRRAAAVHGVEVPAGMEVCASPHHALGTLIEVRSRRRGATWRCIVGDVPRDHDRAAIVRRRIVVEVTPRGAMRLCGTVQEPPRQCPVEVAGV
jgi:hypothetical protein